LRKPFLRAAVVLASALLGVGAVATSAQATGNTGKPCVSANFTADNFVFDNGGATANFALRGDANCAPTEVTLVSYLAPQPKFDVPQYLFAHATTTVSAGQRSGSLTVKVPNCNTQVDLFVGGEKDIIDSLVEGGPRYNDKKIKWFNGGDQDCVQPAVQSVPNCDGSVDLSLSNNGELSGYPVTFEVSYGGRTTRVTVAKGEATKEPIHVPAGSGTITVKAKKLDTVTINWARPDTCLPTATAKNDCTTVTVTVSNPEKNVPVDAEVTYGDDTKTVSVKAGTSEDATFPAGSATTATVAFPGLPGVAKLTVDVAKKECGTAPPSSPATPSSPSSPSTPSTGTPTATASTSVPATTTTPAAAPSTTPVADVSLPKTGSAAGPVAGGAALLLIIGGVLFYLARRRKVKFTS